MSGPITIEYTRNGRDEVEHFDYLVVACDPRDLNLTGRTELEETVCRELTSFTFRTSLYAANRPKRPNCDQADIKDPAKPRTNEPSYAVRFHPGVLEDMDGRPYGFRDEVFAHDPNLVHDPSGKTWATVYQIEKEPLIGRNESVVDSRFNELRDHVIGSDAKENMWFDWDADTSLKPQPEEELLVDYFAHFDTDVIKRGLPWKIRDSQGDKNTLYVASFTCFESVLHCFLYEKMIMDDEGPLMKRGKFPTNKEARFAVVGAGPSGLLFASQHLLKTGYNNFKVFDKADRFGGKTLTHRRTAPSSGEEVACELGTCYLSPAYKPMWHLFGEYDAGRVVALDKGSNHFRSIIDHKVALTNEEHEDGVEYGAWTVRSNITTVPDKKEDMESATDKIVAEMIKQTIMYCVIHAVVMNMKMDDCMPKNPPPPDEDGEEYAENFFQNLAQDLKKLFNKAKCKEDETGPRSMEAKPSHQVGMKTMYVTLRDDEDLFDSFDDIDDFVEDIVGNIVSMDDVEDYFTLDELNEAVQDVYFLTFGDFLKKYRLEKLKSIFVYGYQVQGYGTISRIPCYYGLMWITPATMMEKMKQQYDPPTPGTPESERGTVNIVTKGWQTLWEKIVDKDLQGKLCLGASINSISRAC